jgi:hypothetical protein
MLFSDLDVYKIVACIIIFSINLLKFCNFHGLMHENLPQIKKNEICL